jgi:carbon-monoxide dehydrogenase large subunit
MVIAAEKIIAKGRSIAAHLMEAGEHDIVFEQGKFVVAGTDKGVDLLAVARAAFVPAGLPKDIEPGLFETGTFNGGERTFPNGCLSPKWRSTRGPGRSSWCAILRSTTSGT